MGQGNIMEKKNMKNRFYFSFLYYKVSRIKKSLKFECSYLELIYENVFFKAHI